MSTRRLKSVSVILHAADTSEKLWADIDEVIADALENYGDGDCLERLQSFAESVREPVEIWVDGQTDHGLQFEVRLKHSVGAPDQKVGAKAADS